MCNIVWADDLRPTSDSHIQGTKKKKQNPPRESEGKGNSEIPNKPVCILRLGQHLIANLLLTFFLYLPQLQDKVQQGRDVILEASQDSMSDEDSFTPPQVSPTPPPLLQFNVQISISSKSHTNDYFHCTALTTAKPSKELLNSPEDINFNPTPHSLTTANGAYTGVTKGWDSFARHFTHEFQNLKAEVDTLRTEVKSLRRALNGDEGDEREFFSIPCHYWHIPCNCLVLIYHTHL